MIRMTASTRRFPIQPLGSVVEFLDHLRRPVKAGERPEGDYPYFGANGQQGTINGYIFDEPLVLLAEDGGHFDNPERGVAYKISGKTWVNNHAHVLRPRESIDVDFLFRMLQHRDVSQFITGSTRAKLTKSGAAQITVPIPPLGEQRRIAQVLDSVDALRTKRRSAIALLDDLVQSIFLYMFGDPQENSHAWPTTTLSCLADPGDRINYGVVQPGDEYDNGIALVRVGDLIDGRVNRSAIKRIDPKIEAKCSRSRLKGNEILVGCVGSIGSIALTGRCDIGSNIARAVARIPISSEMQRIFVAEHLRCASVQHYFTSELRTVTQPTLNIKQLSETTVMMPPHDLQAEFVSRITSVDALRKRHLLHLAHLDALFLSLQHCVFHGEL